MRNFFEIRQDNKSVRSRVFDMECYRCQGIIYKNFRLQTNFMLYIYNTYAATT